MVKGFLLACALGMAWLPGVAIAQCGDEEIDKLVDSTGASGDAFAIPGVSGIHALIGAPLDDDDAVNGGVAHAFHFDGTAWVQDAKLGRSGAQAGDLFGGAVAIQGDVAIIGGPAEGAGRSGKAWVFRRSGNDWLEEACLASPVPLANDEFGASVAIDGDLAVVGAPKADGQEAGSGAAWVFRRASGSWGAGEILAGDSAGDSFGYRVGIEGETIVVGAPDEDSRGLNAGIAYVYTNQGGTWQRQQTVVATDTTTGDSFGVVAIDGPLIVVGALLADDGGVDSGAAYVFRFDGVNYVEEQKLVASDASPGDYGGSVAIAGETIVMGAAEHDDQGNDSGTAYVFHFDGKRWVEVEELYASDGVADHAMAFHLAISGDHILLGAPEETPIPGNGAVYAYRDDGLGLSPNKEVYVNGDAVEVTVCGGLEGQPVILAVVTPAFTIIPFIGTFDSNGRWSAQSAPVDSNWPRLTIGLQAYGFRSPGVVGISDIESIEIR